MSWLNEAAEYGFDDLSISSQHEAEALILSENETREMIQAEDKYLLEDSPF